MKILDVTNYRNEPIKELEVGDKIYAQGYTFEIAKIIYQDWFGERNKEHPDWDWGFFCEFTDHNGNPHYWKQYIDGGYVIEKDK